MFDKYPDILSLSDISDILYIGNNNAYDLVDSGKIKAFKIGRVWKIPKKSLEDYISDQIKFTQDNIKQQSKIIQPIIFV